MRLGKHLVVATVLLLAAPGVIATPAVANPDTPAGGTSPGARAFKEGDLASAPAFPEWDPAIAERVARGKAAWESMPQQDVSARSRTCGAR